MRTTLATLTAIGLFLAAPAVAQQTQPGQQEPPAAQQGQPGQPGAGAAPQAPQTETEQRGADRVQQIQTDPPVAGPQQAQADQPEAMTPDRLRQVLQDAGFQQIQIIDAAYLIQAETEDGHTVFMMINPPAGAGGAGMAGAGAGRAPGAAETGGPAATGATRGGGQPGHGGEMQRRMDQDTRRGMGGTEPNAPQQNR